jgi:xylulokinase
MAAPELLFVAVDAGTTGARSCAVDVEGRVVHEARRPYETTTPRPGWAEQDPDDWREAALGSLADLVEAIDGAAIAAIGLTGQCPTIAPFDRRGGALGPGLLYRDNRAAEQAGAMRERIGVEAMHARTGHVAEAFHVAPKLLWLREHDPDVFAAAASFQQPRDVVLRALTGTLATDETHANATVLYDLRARDWDPELQEAFDLEAGLFPPVSPPWAVIGEVTAAVAERTGVAAGCPVVLGAADSQCAAYGSGLFGPGVVSEMAGSSSCLNSVVVEPLADLAVTHYGYLLPDCYCTELGVNTSGSALGWALTRFGFPDYASLEDAAGRVHERLRLGAEDPVQAAPLFLPFLGDGERDDPVLRAAFVGLSDRHGRDELAYAVVEGVALAVTETAAALTAAGSPCDELRVAGGGGRSSVLCALKADLLGAPVRRLVDDSAAVGAALLAAGATGHADLALAAIGRGLERSAVFAPDPAGGEALRIRRAWFREARGSTVVRLPTGGLRTP